MKAYIRDDYATQKKTRGRKAAKLFYMRPNVKFSVAPSNWRQIETEEGKRIGEKPVVALWTLVRLATHAKTNELEIDYAFLINECGLKGVCSQDSMRRYLKTLSATGIIETRIKRNNFNSQKKLLIKIDFEKLNSLDSSALQRKVPSKSSGKFCQDIYIEENKEESKEDKKPLKRVFYSSEKEKKEEKKKFESDVNQQTLEKTSSEDDFLAAPNKSEDKTREAIVIRGKFSNKKSEPPETNHPSIKEQKGRLAEVYSSEEAEQQTTEGELRMNKQHKTKSLEMELVRELHREFDLERLDELQQSLAVIPMKPDKVALRFKQELELNEQERERLKKCLRMIYGRESKIVLLAKKSEKLEQHNKDASNDESSKWQKTKLELESRHGRDSVQVILRKLKVIENGDKVMFRGKDLFVSMFEDKFGRSLEKASQDSGMQFVLESFNQVLDKTTIREIKEGISCEK